MGSHHKNSYMLKHWEAYCAGRFPKDKVLQEAERRFFDTLFVNPVDYSALNGLGNILLFEGELFAAEFFVEKAVACATKAGVAYGDAIHDLEMSPAGANRPVGTGKNRTDHWIPGADARKSAALLALQFAIFSTPSASLRSA